MTVPGSARSEPGHLDPPINTPSADQSPALSPDGLRLTRNRKTFGVEKARCSLLPFFLLKSACSCFSKMFPQMFPQHTTPHDTRGARQCRCFLTSEPLSMCLIELKVRCSTN